MFGLWLIFKHVTQSPECYERHLHSGSSRAKESSRARPGEEGPTPRAPVRDEKPQSEPLLLVLVATAIYTWLVNAQRHVPLWSVPGSMQRGTHGWMRFCFSLKMHPHLLQQEVLRIPECLALTIPSYGK